MIYGYDEAQLFPVRSLYDDGMINTYINAVQRDYERGLADQKEFVSKYGDFTSPFSKDIDSWNNLTFNRLQNAMDALRAQGIDPVRSQEGRAAMNQIIMGTEYGKLAQLRQSAKAGEEYQKAAGILRSKGLYDPELEKMMGVGDMQTWDTLKNGAWQTTSPVEAKNLYDLTHERFDPLKHQNFDLGQGRDKYHRMKGVSEEQMLPILDSALDGVKGTPYYKYFLNKYGSDEAIKAAIIDVNRGVLHNEEVDDSWAQLQWKERQENYRASLKTNPKNDDQDLGGFLPRLQTFLDGLSVIGLNYNNSDDNAIKKAQRNKLSQYRKKVGYSGTTSYALAYNCDEDEIMNRIHSSDWNDDTNKVIITNANKHKFVKIQTVSSRNGFASPNVGKLNKTNKSPIADDKKTAEMRLAGGNRNMIQQYEPRDNKVHQYIKMYDDDHEEWWMDDGPVDLTSGKAQGADSKTLHDWHQSQKQIASAVDERQKVD